MLLSTPVPNMFKARRQRLARENPGTLFIFPSNPNAIRNNDVHYPYRQDSTFYYLCGFEEPESYLILNDDKAYLFVQPRNPEREIWDGERYGKEGALKIFGVDEAFINQELEAELPKLLGRCERVAYRMCLWEAQDRRVLAIIDGFRSSMGRSGRGLLPIIDSFEKVGEMRLFKEPSEVALLRKAGKITGEAHEVLMREVRPGMNEAEVEALINYLFRKNGCQRMGYNSIVAGGKNATCLHYVSNNEVLRDGDLLLIDAGGEYDYYTADITRTFPVGKRFSPAQAKIYDLVLKVQKEAVAAVRPGIRLLDIHDGASRGLIEGLLSLGLLSGKADEILKNGGLKRFYPHGTSHWLGLDVHDTGIYRIEEKSRVLEPGMCLTVEPGLYFQPGDKEVPEEYRNIGIRIEDDVVVTASGCEVLTSSAPKERGAIEGLRG